MQHETEHSEKLPSRLQVLADAVVVQYLEQQQEEDKYLLDSRKMKETLNGVFIAMIGRGIDDSDIKRVTQDTSIGKVENIIVTVNEDINTEQSTLSTVNSKDHSIGDQDTTDVNEDIDKITVDEPGRFWRLPNNFPGWKVYLTRLMQERRNLVCVSDMVKETREEDKSETTKLQSAISNALSTSLKDGKMIGVNVTDEQYRYYGLPEFFDGSHIKEDVLSNFKQLLGRDEIDYQLQYSTITTSGTRSTSTSTNNPTTTSIARLRKSEEEEEENAGEEEGEQSRSVRRSKLSLF